MLQISQKLSLESLELESWVCSDFYRLHRIVLLLVHTVVRPPVLHQPLSSSGHVASQLQQSLYICHSYRIVFIRE